MMAKGQGSIIQVAGAGGRVAERTDSRRPDVA